MWSSVILLAVNATILACLVITNLTAATPNGCVYLGVTLPYGELKNPSVTAIAAAYRRRCWLWAVPMLALSLPLLWLPYPSLEMTYLLVWLAAAFWRYSRLYRVYNGKMRALKQQNGWLRHLQRTVSVDTVVSAQKDRLPLSSRWFLPSLAFALFPVVLGTARRGELLPEVWIPGAVALVTVLLSLWLHRILCRGKTKAYCEDSAVNLACNQLERRAWSRCWIALATIHSILFAISALTSAAAGPGRFSAVPVVSLCLIGACLAIIPLTHRSIRKRQERLLAAARSPIVEDEDDCWRGMFYHNPNDRRVMVEKRVGIGYTCNMASKRGRMITYGSFALIAVIVVPLLVMFYVLDFSSFGMRVEGDRLVFSAPVYGASIPLEDIISVEVMDALPPFTRTNGADTGAYLLGNFTIQGVGRAKLYISRDAPYIAVKTEGLTYLYNEKTPAGTMASYEWLLHLYNPI